jgi:hypothetical protein
MLPDATAIVRRYAPVICADVDACLFEIRRRRPLLLFTHRQRSIRIRIVVQAARAAADISLSMLLFASSFARDEQEEKTLLRHGEHGFCAFNMSTAIAHGQIADSGTPADAVSHAYCRQRSPTAAAVANAECMH